MHGRGRGGVNVWMYGIPLLEAGWHDRGRGSLLLLEGWADHDKLSTHQKPPAQHRAGQCVWGGGLALLSRCIRFRVR